MVNEETPDERLKKYKERLVKMAQSEGRESKINNNIEKPIVKREPPPEPIPKDAPLGPRPKPPPILESPAKRELRESQVVKKRREALLSKLKSKSGKSRIMLKAREKAIDSQLKEMKSRKSKLELQYKRKVIDREEYERRMAILVSAGHDLLKEKAEIDKTLSK